MTGRPALAGGHDARLRWSGGALTLLVHLTAVALILLLFGGEMVPVEPPAPLVADFLPLPETPPPDPVVERERPLDLQALRPEPAPPSARSAGSTPSAPPLRPVSPIPSVQEVQAGPGRAGVEPNGVGQGGAGQGGTGVGSGGGPGDAAGGPPRRLAAAEWIERLTSTEMLPYWPRRAAALGLDGRAWLACQVTRSNRARNCRLLAETPRGLGFGYAALRMARLFRIRPPSVDGQPQYDAWVRIPVVFDAQE